MARYDAAQASPAHPTPSAGLAACNQLPPYYAKKMITPTDIWGTPVGRLTCGPTMLTRTQGLLSQQTILAVVTVGFELNGPAADSCTSRPNQHRRDCLLLPPVAGCAAIEASSPPTTPTASQALRRRQPDTAAKLVNPRTPLRVGIHCRVFPGFASSPS